MNETTEHGPVDGRAARRIAADVVAKELELRAPVRLERGTFFGAPEWPVWVVTVPREWTGVGAESVIAVCPRTGNVLFRGLIGE
jgi:hypothetical protein